jgi:hypothetical protein
MKTVKNIIFIVLLISVVSQYWGHEIAGYYNHQSKIESSTDSNCAQSIVSSESSLEEEIPFVLPKNSIQAVQIKCERFISFTIFSPLKLYYSIWLPPDIS